MESVPNSSRVSYSSGYFITEGWQGTRFRPAAGPIPNQTQTENLRRCDCGPVRTAHAAAQTLLRTNCCAACCFPTGDVEESAGVFQGKYHFSSPTVQVNDKRAAWHSNGSWTLERLACGPGAYCPCDKSGNSSLPCCFIRRRTAKRSHDCYERSRANIRAVHRTRLPRNSMEALGNQGLQRACHRDARAQLG